MTKIALSALQKQMINYLIDDDISIEQHIVQQGNISNKIRLHIYKNAYQARLKEVIDNDHQMLGLYLGDDLFDQMVVSYIKHYPSQQTSLRHYADQLPQHLAIEPPFCDHPILSELASFERLLLVAFDAADAQRYTRKDLQQLAHDEWPELVFHFHPSVQLINFQWNTVESWQALKQELSPNPATRLNSTWLLWRNHDRLTEFRSLTEEETVLIKMILSGESFSSLCEFLLNTTSEEEVSAFALQYVITWLDNGIIRKI